MITVRPAAEADVPAMSEVMTASVTELCGADHHNDPDSIAQWVANRTHEGVRAMMARPGQQFFVAERQGKIAAVGAINHEGVVIFNYVSPAPIQRGEPGADARLEEALAAAGHAEGRLVSTVTAHRFYLEGGWIDDGPPLIEGFSTSYPMRKRL